MSAFLAWKLFLSLWRRKGSHRPLLGAAWGLALSLVPLVLVTVVADGMIQGITARYLETYTYHLQLLPLGGAGPDAQASAREAAAALTGFQGLWWERQGFGIAFSDSGRLGVTLRGWEPSFLEDPGLRRYLNLSEGALDLSDPQGLLLGRQASRVLGLKTGDSLRLLTARSAPGRGYVPRVSTFRVMGIVSTGYDDLDKIWAVLPLETADRLLPQAEYPLIGGMKIEEPFTQAEEASARLQDALPPGWRVYTWYELAQGQYRNYAATRALLLFLMGLIVVVASFNLSSALVMTVWEHQRDIALWKSLGWSRGGVERVFLWLGGLTGAAGAAAGLSLGVLLAWGLNPVIRGMEALSRLWAASPLLEPSYYLEEIPVQLDPGLLGIFAFGALALSLLMSWWPSRRASGLRPLSVLRKV